MKEHIIQKRKTRKIVEKAVMMNKSVQLKMDFDFNVTAWVPAAKINKPMPQINITLNVSHDDVRIGCDKTQQLIDGLIEVVAFLQKNKDTLDQTAEQQRSKWLELCNQKANSVMRIVEFEKQA